MGRPSGVLLAGMVLGGAVGGVVWYLYPPAIVGVVVAGGLVGLHTASVYRQGLSVGTGIETVLICILLLLTAVAGTGIQPVDESAEAVTGDALAVGITHLEPVLLTDRPAPTQVAAAGSGSGASTVGDRANGSAPPGPALNETRLERRIHDRVNDRRAARGRAKLAFDPALRDIGAEYSKRMHEKAFFSHVGPEGDTFYDRYRDAGYNCVAMRWGTLSRTGGENIFYYKYRVNESATAEDVERRIAAKTVTELMNSRPHRENILRRAWDDQGIGVHVTSNNQVYVTQLFC